MRPDDPTPDQRPPHDEARLRRLERDLRRLTLAATALGVALLVVLASAFRSQAPEVIRARGLVIVDEAGRERILIGAPIPAARNRVRTDTARVRRLWAARFPDRDAYMGYYARYRHSMHGMLVLDENGFDRLAIGDSTPDPNIGRRIGPATGIEINDDQGFERSGYALLDVGGTKRVVLGLDGRNGTEGLALSLFDGGPAGLFAYGPNQRVAFFGHSPANDARTTLTTPLVGLLVKEGRTVKHVLGIQEPPPAR